MSSTHGYFAFYHYRGFFNQWKGVNIIWFHTGTFKANKMNCEACVWKKMLLVTSIFLPGSTIRIPNISKWCFSQFKFWFAYERFLPFSRIWTSWSSHHSITLRSFQLWKIRLFLRLFTLKSQLFCLQILIYCSHKQTVWHWWAWHQPRVQTMSKLSKL